jgi:helicase associated protein
VAGIGTLTEPTGSRASPVCRSSSSARAMRASHTDTGRTATRLGNGSKSNVSYIGGADEEGLAPERRARLEAVPRWSWSPREARWENGFARLELFVEREGHSRGPPAYRDDEGFRLGAWVDAQRVYRRQDVLSEERQKRLQALPGWIWNPEKVAGRTARLVFGASRGARRIAASPTHIETKTGTGSETGSIDSRVSRPTRRDQAQAAGIPSRLDLGRAQGNGKRWKVNSAPRGDCVRPAHAGDGPSLHRDHSTSDG